MQEGLRGRERGRHRAARLASAAGFVAASVLLAGCGGGSMFGGSSDSGPSFGDRFSQLFGSKSQAVGEAPPPAAADELECPPVAIRSGASTYAVAAPGKQPVGSDLRYQATIVRTARDCTRNGDQIVARIGIQGRVIAGPAGNPPSVEVPLRVAVVQSGIQEKTITTKAYKTTVSMAEASSVPFSFVAEDIVYPVPAPALSDSYVFYIGFDPQILTPERPARAAKKKK